MKTIAYTGTSDFQTFGKADFAKAGVEDGKKITFARHEPTEVDDDIAQVLLDREGLFGGYSFTDVTEEGEDENTEEAQAVAQAEAAASTKPKKKTSGSSATTDGTASADPGPTSTGAGTSTPSTSR